MTFGGRSSLDSSIGALHGSIVRVYCISTEFRSCGLHKNGKEEHLEPEMGSGWMLEDHTTPLWTVHLSPLVPVRFGDANY